MGTEKSVSLRLGIIVREAPGVTRWAGTVWRAIAVLPGAPPADWVELRRDGDVAEYHAATLPLTLYRTDTDAYLTALNMNPPKVFVVMRREGAKVVLTDVTASPFEAQDHADNGEDQVEPVEMPEGLVAWVRDFVERHHVEEEFVKRRRDKVRTDRKDDGKGDPRVRQLADVYRAPTDRKVRGS